ncbi:MAG: alcohol dehydrogenase catalytic domain-containing protein [Cyanobacteria bacterium]|nr:alcohol dehydrogenase catalytic domain-containing protein [Cyanobacteriota bacterium]
MNTTLAQTLNDITNSTKTMAAAAVTADGILAPCEIAIPKTPENGALLEVLASGLCGSDIDKLQPSKRKPGQILGHEFVGRIVELNSLPGKVWQNRNWQIGDRLVSSHHVPCLTCELCLQGKEPMCPSFKQSNISPGAFCEWTAITEAHLNHTAFKIPDDITDIEATCVEPLACVLRALRRLEGFLIGMRAGHSTDPNPAAPHVGVIGLGFIGCLFAMALHTHIAGKAPLTTHPVVGFEKNPERFNLAKKHLQVDPPSLEDPSLDVIILTVVTPSTLQLALSQLRDGGTLLLFASRGDSNVPESKDCLDPKTLYFREISVITSYSPCLIDLKTSADLIFNRRIPLQNLLSDSPVLTVSLQNLQSAVEDYQTGKLFKVIVDPMLSRTNDRN